MPYPPNLDLTVLEGIPKRPLAAAPLHTGERWLCRGAVVTSGPRADTYHVPLPAFPSAEPGGCAQSKAPAAEFCAGEDGASLPRGPHSGCSAVPWPPACCLSSRLTGRAARAFPERERPWPSDSKVGRYRLAMGEREEGASCASCLHHIKLNVPVSCGLKYPHTRVSQHLFSVPRMPCSFCLTLCES